MTHNGRNSGFKLSNEIFEMIDGNWGKSERQLNSLHSKSFSVQIEMSVDSRPSNRTNVTSRTKHVAFTPTWEGGGGVILKSVPLGTPLSFWAFPQRLNQLLHKYLSRNSPKYSKYHDDISNDQCISKIPANTSVQNKINYF